MGPGGLSTGLGKRSSLLTGLLTCSPFCPQILSPPRSPQPPSDIIDGCVRPPLLEMLASEENCNVLPQPTGYSPNTFALCSFSHLNAVLNAPPSPGCWVSVPDLFRLFSPDTLALAISFAWNVLSPTLCMFTMCNHVHV